MFSKVLTVCFVLYTVQVLGGSIKTKLSVEVQNVVNEIDMKSLLLESDIKKAAADEKTQLNTVKLNNKMALKQLKTAVKEGKGTLCGQIASLQAHAVEQRADDLKLCNKKLSLKDLQKDLHGYLRNLHEDAMLVDRYCPFVHSTPEEIAQCITDSVSALKAKLNDIDSFIGAGLSNHQNEISACLTSIVDDVQLESGRIQIEMAECLNPTTAAPEEPTQDSSESNESHSSESSESEESNESGSGSSETSDAPIEHETEGGNDENDGGEGGDEEQTSESSNNGEGGNDDEGTTAGDDQEGGDNDGNTVGDGETEKPAEGNEETPADDEETTPVDKETPVDEEKPADEETPADEKTPIENGETPVEDTNGDKEEVASEEPAQPEQPIKDDDEINIEY